MTRQQKTKRDRSEQRASRDRRQVVARGMSVLRNGVVHRDHLREQGITRDHVRVELAAHRWVRLGRHTVFVGDPWPTWHWERAAPPASGPQDWTARAWWAVWETGWGTVLDGPSALIAAGLERYEEPAIHVRVPIKARVRTLPGVVVRRSRHIDQEVGGGLPRIAPAVAVLNAAAHAKSDRQAAYLLATTVQQGIVSTNDLLARWRAMHYRPNRGEFLDVVIADVCDGAHALAELDFAALCRSRGLPEPSRQVVRTGPDGRIYLDVWWEEFGVGVEIDGVQHGWGLNAVSDALRDNSILLRDGLLLRIPTLGLRLSPSAFLDQVEQLLKLGRRLRAATTVAPTGG